MNHINNTENFKTISSNKVTVPADILQKWQKYLAKNTAPKDYSLSQKYRLALTEKMYDQEVEGRILFHMTITYKPYGDRVYREQDVNNFFKNFYTKTFLPKLMGTRNYHTNHMKSIQPICYCFIDEHTMQSERMLKVAIPTNPNDYIITFPIRLHHHAILAVHPETLKNMKRIEGENTLNGGDFTYKIMTSHIRQCEAQTLLYASKKLKQYPDFMSFPNTFKRNRNRIGGMSDAERSALLEIARN